MCVEIYYNVNSRGFYYLAEIAKRNNKENSENDFMSDNLNLSYVCQYIMLVENIYCHVSAFT